MPGRPVPDTAATQATLDPGRGRRNSTPRSSPRALRAPIAICPRDTRTGPPPSSAFHARFVVAFPYSTTFRSGSADASKRASGTTSIEPLPSYQNCSASKRAFAKAHAFSSSLPCVP